MQPSTRVRGDRAAALLVALAVNVWAAWALSQAMRSAPGPHPDAVILQAVWLPRHVPEPPAVASIPSRPLATRTIQRRPQAPTPPDAVRPHAAAQGPSPTQPTDARPMSAVYLAQIRQVAGEAMDDAIAPQDPLANRIARLPGKAANRFRMREPMSPARAVAMAGRLFGGSDPGEPCRSNRAEIAALATQGDSARLQQEVDVERRWCRP